MCSVSKGLFITPARTEASVQTVWERLEEELGNRLMLVS